jgi:hypothetical protein
MDVFSTSVFVATILFATSLGVWLALRETTCAESKPRKKYFSLLRTSLVCLLAKSTNLKSLKTLSKELWNNGRYEEASWLKEEIQRIKLLMLKK